MLPNCHCMQVSSLANNNQDGCRRHLFQSGLLSVTLFPNVYYITFNVSIIFASVLSNVCLIFWFNVLGGDWSFMPAVQFLFIQQITFFEGSDFCSLKENLLVEELLKMKTMYIMFLYICRINFRNLMIRYSPFRCILIFQDILLNLNHVQLNFLSFV